MDRPGPVAAPGDRGRAITAFSRGITSATLLESARRGPLRGSALLAAVTPVDLDRLLHGARLVHLARGDHLILGGSRPTTFWIVLDGYVKETRALEDGSVALCGFRGPGDLVGEVAALWRDPCPHDATALGAGTALAVPVADLHAAMTASPRLQTAVLSAVSSRATAAEWALARNDVGDISVRISLAILDLVDRWGRRVGSEVHVDVPLTQSELAEWVGTSRETTAKVLQRLRRAGVVATGRRHIAVRDLEVLRTYVHEGQAHALALPA